MSVEDLKEFGKVVAENQEYQEQCKEIGIDDIDGLMSYAKELGYEFSPDDAMALAEEAGVTTEELSEDDLEKVAGGATNVIAAAATSLAAAITAGSIAVTSAAAQIVKNW